MNTTPRKTDIDYLDSDMSITDVENSPFITVRDYQTKMTKLSNENFTLKLLLFGLQKDFRMFLKSRNIQDDVIDLIMNQQKTISTLTAEIGQNSDLMNSVHDSNIPPQSPTLKQQLTMALDSNLQLMNELKEKEQQQYDNVAESSILFDDGAHANLTNLELNNKNKELSNENELLHQKNDALANEITEYQKENNDLLQKVTDLTHTMKNQQDLGHLEDAQDKIDELESKNAQLEKDLNDAISQLEDMSDKNNKLMIENMKLKEDNNQLGDQLSDQNELVEQLKNANDNLNVGNSKLMRALNVLYFDDILPKFEELMKENADLQRQNNQLNEQISLLSNNNNNTSELKEQIYQLKAEIQKLQLQLQHLKDLKKDDYDELSMKNHNLKGKKQSIQSSINRLNSGNNNNYSNITSTSFSPRKRPLSPMANIDLLWNEAKNENDKLTKEVDDLYNLLNEKLNSKINALTNELAKTHSIQKENDELKNQNNSLIRDLNNLQNENLALAQQIEIFKAENEDLSSENDNLRKQPRFNTMATTPIKFSLNNNSIIEELRKQIDALQAENDQLNLENQNLLHDQLETSPIEGKEDQQNNEIKELRNSLQKEEKMRQELSKYIIEVLNFVDDKINAFIDDFEECFGRMSKNFHKFIGVILTLTQSVNSGNRQQVQELAQFGRSIINDMMRGAHICLSNCKGIKLDTINPPLISREDRKKLTLLQKKWDTPVVGDLARFIREENERSMLNNDPSLRNQRDSLDFAKLIEQLQLIIHCIWKELGNGRTEPQISTLLQWKVNGETITQNAINLLTESVKKLRETIEIQKKIIESGSESGLSPQVVNLIQLVRREVRNLSKQMADEYQGLLEFTDRERLPQ